MSSAQNGETGESEVRWEGREGRGKVEEVEGSQGL